jgi:hypothetical protein
MFSYIASILGFQGQTNSTQATTAPGRTHISCEGYGYTLPNQRIRLQVCDKNSNVVRIFGYAPQEELSKAVWHPVSEFRVDGPYIHYHLGDSPASVKYIMGDEWCSQLQSNPWNSSKGDIIWRPSATSNDTCDSQPTPKDDPALLAEERSHSLRMRRCGAVAIFTLENARDWEDGQRRRSPRYLFGWPKSGGVWVLRSPWSEPAPERPEGYAEDLERRLADAHEEQAREAVYLALAVEVKVQETMEDLCRVLEEGGAQFYAAIEDSPEAVELNLF